MSEAEFKDIVSTLSRRLYSVSFRILRSREDAEDAVQETFLKMWKMRNRLSEYNSTEALATTIARNHCIDFLRRKRTDSLDDPGYKYHVNDNNETPFEILRASETNNLIVALMEKMPQAYSEVIRKRDIEGLDYKDIAEKTHQNINTIRVTLSRARKMLRDDYNKAVYEETRDTRIIGKVL
jgi:RNA polymerase sigma factor (sigma-70 family)